MSSYIDAINQTTTSTLGTSTAQSTSDAIMGKEDFLALLVAQLQNQDPLNPDEPTEFTAQLAQFSSLEQLFTLNESMGTLVTSNSNSDKLSTLSTIGKDVAYVSSSFEYTGDDVEIGYQLDNSAKEVTISLQLDGVTQKTFTAEELSSGNHYITWDGLTSDGDQAPIGDYSIVLTAKSASGETVSISPLVKSEVTGVDLGSDSGTILMTRNGEVSYSSILGVYDPDSSAGSDG